MENVYLQLGAVAFLGVALLALIKRLDTMAQSMGRLEANVSVLVQAWAAEKGIRLPDPPPPATSPAPASVVDLAKGGAHN